MGIDGVHVRAEIQIRVGKRHMNDFIYIGDMAMQVEYPEPGELLQHGVDTAHGLSAVNAPAGKEKRNVLRLHVVEQRMKGSIVDGQFRLLAETER